MSQSWQEESVSGYSGLAEPMIQDKPRNQTSLKVLVSLFIGGMGCVLLYSQVSGSAQPLGVQKSATSMAMVGQPMKAQLQKAESNAMYAAAANLRAQSPSARSAAVRAWAFGSAVRSAEREGARAGCRGQLTCVRAVGLIFGTQGGNTEEVAGIIAGAAGLEAQNIEDISAADLAGFDGIIAGVPTWHTGADEQRSGTTWDDYLEEIRTLDLCGKPVAVFGLGDQGGYGDNFCDAIEELHSTFEAAGAKMLGYTADSDYPDYSESKSVKDGKFLGMPFDGDNEPEKHEDRAKKWVEQLKSEGMPIR